MKADELKAGDIIAFRFPDCNLCFHPSAATEQGAFAQAWQVLDVDKRRGEVTVALVQRVEQVFPFEVLEWMEKTSHGEAEPHKSPCAWKDCPACDHHGGGR